MQIRRGQSATGDPTRRERAAGVLGAGRAPGAGTAPHPAPLGRVVRHPQADAVVQEADQRPTDGQHGLHRHADGPHPALQAILARRPADPEEVGAQLDSNARRAPSVWTRVSLPLLC